MDEPDPTAKELSAWFEGLLDVCDRSVFAVATHEPHRQAAILGVLTRNARTIVAGELDTTGALFIPLCFVLTASCRRLGLVPRERAWLAAIANVRRLGDQLRAVEATAPWPLGTPATIFKQHLDEALVNAGVTDHPTILDHHNRQLALGLAVNWALRFLVGYAIETPTGSGPRTAVQDLAWVRGVLEQAKRAA